MTVQNNPLLGKLCVKFDTTLINCRKSNDARQKIIKELKKELKKIDTKSFRYNGYVYYVRSKFSQKRVDVNKLKNKYPKIYEECLKNIVVSEAIVRRLDNAKNC